MRRVWLLPLACLAICRAEEFPRPSERLRMLPAEDWLPRRERASWEFALERPVAGLALTLGECTLRQPLGSRLNAQAWLWTLDSALIAQRAAGIGLTLHGSAAAVSARLREEWVVLDSRVETRRRRADFAIGWGSRELRAGLRARLRRELLLDAALQLQVVGLGLGVEREASAFGGENIWKLGCRVQLAPRFWLGLQARPHDADLLLLSGHGRLQLRLAIAASGAQMGGVALGTEWLR